MRTLMIIAADRISDWINKGAFISRYYNPGDLFDEVHVVLLNRESPNPEALQKMVGRARLRVHCFPTGIPHFVATLGWSVPLLRLWSRQIVRLAREIKPDLIRCHWGFLNGFAAREIRQELGTPYIISLHSNLDVDIRRDMGLLRWIRDRRFQVWERDVLADASRVLPVYEAIVPYLKRHGLSNYEVAHNVINPENIRHKTSWELHDPVRIVCVGRHYKFKNPQNLIRAVAGMPGARLDLFGNGELHESLKKLAADLGASDRIRFIAEVRNDQLCGSLPDYDIWAGHSNHWEISKATLEALLTGLPVVLNHPINGLSPEQPADIGLYVEDTPKAYADALRRLIDDKAFREALARRGRAFADGRFSPPACEARFVRIYNEVLGATR